MSNCTSYFPIPQLEDEVEEAEIKASTGIVSERHQRHLPGPWEEEEEEEEEDIEEEEEEVEEERKLLKAPGLCVRPLEVILASERKTHIQAGRWQNWIRQAPSFLLNFCFSVCSGESSSCL